MPSWGDAQDPEMALCSDVGILDSEPAGDLGTVSLQGACFAPESSHSGSGREKHCLRALQGGGGRGTR